MQRIPGKSATLSAGITSPKNALTKISTEEMHDTNVHSEPNDLKDDLFIKLRTVPNVDTFPLTNLVGIRGFYIICQRSGSFQS